MYILSDDTTVFCAGERDQAIQQLNKALRELYSWCLDNRLTLHPKKSEIMLLSKTSFACGGYSIWRYIPVENQVVHSTFKF